MTIGISNIAVAGAVQVSRPTSGIEIKGQAANAKPPVQNVSDVVVNGSRQTARQAQALTGLENQHRAAEVVRHAVSAFGQIGKALGQMQEALRQVKLYPPYPADNQDRMDLLNSIAGLRKQIDALTFPPPEREQVSLVGDPQQIEAAGDISFTLGGQPHILHAQPVHTGAEGLNIPLLGEHAGEAEVDQALGLLAMAQERLAARKAAFSKELDAILLPQASGVDELLQTSKGELASRTGPIGRVTVGLVES